MARRLVSDSPSLLPSSAVSGAAAIDTAAIEKTLENYPKPTIMQADFIPMPFGLGFQGMEMRNAIFSSVAEPNKVLGEKKVAAAKESTSVLRFEALLNASRRDCDVTWKGVAAKDSSRNAIGLNLPLIEKPGVSKPGDSALRIVDGGAIIADLCSGKLKGVVKGAEMELHVPTTMAKDLIVTLAGVQSWLDSSRSGLQFHVKGSELANNQGYVTLAIKRDFDVDQAALLQELGAQPMQALKDSFRVVASKDKVHVTTDTFLHTCLKRAYETRFGKKGTELGSPSVYAAEGFASYPKSLFDALYDPLEKQIAKCTASFLSMTDFALQFEAKPYTNIYGKVNPSTLHFRVDLASGNFEGDAGKDYFQGNVKIALTIATIETNKA